VRQHWYASPQDLRRPSAMSGGSASVVAGPLKGLREDEDDEVDGDHRWHFRYNRRLSNFSHAVSVVNFAKNGKWLVIATASGDVKVWDTSCWAEVAKLRANSQSPEVVSRASQRRSSSPRSVRAIRALEISPSQRYLVSCHASALDIFNCLPPWDLECSIPSKVCPATGEIASWCCMAFAPMEEACDLMGRTGHDNHLAALSTTHLCVFDYSGGWGSKEEVLQPKRTRSLVNSPLPTSIGYTACGNWLVCGYESGQLQIWNAFSLTLERSLISHTGQVNCLTFSPRRAKYDARFVSCGLDRTLRVWHCRGWVVEQIVPETKADRSGVRMCTFSAEGSWLASVAMELSIYRVEISRKMRFSLRLHQRLSAVCGIEGLCTAAFCEGTDTLSVGSRDGVLGLWTKCAGLPPEGPLPMPKLEEKVEKTKPSNADPVHFPKPMSRVSPEGLRPMRMQFPRQTNVDWLNRATLRSSSGSGNSISSVAARLLAGSSAGSAPSLRDDEVATSSQGLGDRSNSLPELRRWSSAHGSEDVLDTFCRSQFPSNLRQVAIASSKAVECLNNPDSTATGGPSPNRRLVQRIQLEPRAIC